MKEKLNLDIYRLIASFLIVAIHIYPFESISTNLDFLFTHVFCRIGVPFFLMLTGYFIIDKSLKNKDSLIKYTKKIIEIYLISIIIYIPINIYSGVLSDINVFKLIKMIFINGTMYHLWYFPGLILGLWLTYFILKKVDKKYILPIFIILYIFGLLGDSYYGIIEKVEVIKIIYDFIFKIFDYTRNGIFYVPIFLYLGYIYSIEKKKDNKNNKNNKLLTVVFIILMLLEGIILKYFNLQGHDSMYLFLIPLMYYLFNLLINNNNGTNKKLRELSTIIYIMHPFFIVVIRFVGKFLNITNIIVNNSIINYLLVLTITIIFAYSLLTIKELIKSRNLKK